MGEQDRAGREGSGFPDGLIPSSLEMSPPERRMTLLIEALRGRQRRRPDLVVRPWWTSSEEGARGRLGCVVEYCPRGRETAEVAVRVDRVTVDGPAGAIEVDLDLVGGWVLEGRETGSPETLINYLLRLADRALGEAA